MITARYHREIPQRYRLEAATCEGCGTMVMTSAIRMRAGKRLCAICRSTKPGGVKRTKRGGYVTTGKPRPTELERARVAAELERFDSMAARHRSELGLLYGSCMDPSLSIKSA